MNKEFWEEPEDELIDGSYTFEEKNELLDVMKQLGLADELVTSVDAELEETEEKDSKVIFVSSDGEIVYKAIIAPSSALRSGRGPEIFPGARPDVVLAVYSEEFIESIVEKIEREDAGLRDELWENEVSALVDEVISCYAERPDNWGDFF